MSLSTQMKDAAPFAAKAFGWLAVVLVVLLLLYAVFLLPEQVASSVGEVEGVMPGGAHVYATDIEFDGWRPVVLAQWHTCMSSTFEVGYFRFDVVTREVLESHSEDWSEDTAQSGE